MKQAERMIRAVDRFQQRHVVLAFPFAVVKKFGDDQAGALASLIAYYGFFSLFPLLLLLVSLLGLVLVGHPQLQRSIVDTALGGFPVIGDQIASQAGIHAIAGNLAAIVVGSVGAAWSGLAVAQATQRAMNTVWDIPKSDWPNFVFRRLRALLMLVILGSITVISTFTSGWGSSGALPSLVLSVVGWMLSLGLNLLLFTLAYQVLTARSLRWRDVLPGAIVAALLWSLLQALGGYYVTHQLRSAGNVYGTFAVVIGLLVWIHLGAQVTLLGAELNVVRTRRLWPRSLIQPPINDGDKRVYRAIMRRARMRPEVALRVWFTDGAERSADQVDPSPRARGAPGDGFPADGDPTPQGRRGAASS